MRTFFFIFSLLIATCLGLYSFDARNDKEQYFSFYSNSIEQFSVEQKQLKLLIQESVDLKKNENSIQSQINKVRIKLKKIDFWIRYFEPTKYKLVNGPLPVEWETEVFEKFEKPYKRDGAGLTLAYQALEEPTVNKDELLMLIDTSIRAIECYNADSITRELKQFDHFYLCNRLFLLNLAAIYTTGFENPNASEIIPELKVLLEAVSDIYKEFNLAFPQKALPLYYLSLFGQMHSFVIAQPGNFEKFDHFEFIKTFVNPLFSINQVLIEEYGVRSKSMVDYTLNRNAKSIFSKNLYYGQNEKGVFLRVNDSISLREIDRLGKLLFYDPILSGNNLRSCASCHLPEQYFTDTSKPTPIDFDRKRPLNRNAPSLINATFNHLVMVDGSHITLQEQVLGVVTNKKEMGADINEVVRKVISCREYREGFEKLLPYTPLDEEISINHISSAISYYYGKFSQFEAPFDLMMNQSKQVNENVKKGFNVFMGKAQCATCHFVPYFNGVKPPYIGSEFEVLGVPEDSAYTTLSDDKGRFLVNPAKETLNAFRTGSLRNIMRTAPYMHNGVFTTMEQVIDFYDKGGGVGRGLTVSNQTLSSDSLKLTLDEKKALLSFMESLTESVKFENAPRRLPTSSKVKLNSRKVKGIY